MLDLAGIVSDSVVDGPGIRVAIFSQGCPHHCPGCHNPETWDFGTGTGIDEETVVEIVKSNPLCRGVTFSGGEPFAQAEGFTKLARLLKEEGYELASYSGYTFEELICGTPAQRELLGELDILIDGRFEQSLKSLEVPFRGSTNQRVVDVKASLEAGNAVETKSLRWHGEF